MRIDPHVHFRDGVQRHKETIAHGLELATDQGVDMVFDMPNTQPLLLRETDVENRLALVPEGQRHRYYMYVGLTGDPKQLEEAVDLAQHHPHVIGLKLFAGRSTGDLSVPGQPEQAGVYRLLTQTGYTGVLAVHCEKEACFAGEFDPQIPYSHGQNRPKAAEIASVQDQIQHAENAVFMGSLHICHISCPEAVDLVTQARSRMRITCGVTPHHLMWDDDMLQRPDGLLYKTNPPLRAKDDVAGLREKLCQGHIDWIETDHAPHTIGEKMHGPYPSGYPALYVYADCVERFLPELGLDEKRIYDLTCGTIQAVFNLSE